MSDTELEMKIDDILNGMTEFDTEVVKEVETPKVEEVKEVEKPVETNKKKETKKEEKKMKTKKDDKKKKTPDAPKVKVRMTVNDMNDIKTIVGEKVKKLRESGDEKAANELEEKLELLLKDIDKMNVAWKERHEAYLVRVKTRDAHEALKKKVSEGVIGLCGLPLSKTNELIPHKVGV